jgi:hypothetical protein
MKVKINTTVIPLYNFYEQIDFATKLNTLSFTTTNEMLDQMPLAFDELSNKVKEPITELSLLDDNDNVLISFTGYTALNTTRLLDKTLNKLTIDIKYNK